MKRNKCNDLGPKRVATRHQFALTKYFSEILRLCDFSLLNDVVPNTRFIDNIIEVTFTISCEHWHVFFGVHVDEFSAYVKLKYSQVKKKNQAFIVDIINYHHNCE